MEHVISNSSNLKTENVGLPFCYIKVTCCKNVFHKRHRQLDFHFLMLFLKHGKELKSSNFFCIKGQVFRDKKDVVSGPYLTVLISGILIITHS